MELSAASELRFGSHEQWFGGWLGAKKVRSAAQTWFAQTASEELLIVTDQ